MEAKYSKETGFVGVPSIPRCFENPKLISMYKKMFVASDNKPLHVIIKNNNMTLRVATLRDLGA